MTQYKEHINPDNKVEDQDTVLKRVPLVASNGDSNLPQEPTCAGVVRYFPRKRGRYAPDTRPVLAFGSEGDHRRASECRVFC